MVDRVYKHDLPRLRRSLEELKSGFSSLETKTDWTGLRIEPLLKHIESLERSLSAGEFSRESSRLTKGVAMFHSDLVYLRTNVAELRRLLHSELKKSAKGKT
jgi:predicted  nucleic acid-binding Zn-ribbon protein